MEYAFYNGEFYEKNELKIPLTDRSVFFGDGIYEALIGRSGGIYLLEEHFDRFWKNAEIMDLKPDFTREELSSRLSEIISRSGFYEYFIYFQLTRHSEERTHTYKGNKTNLLITIREHTVPCTDTKLKLITAEDVRYRMCNVKTLNLLPNVLASKKAEKAGCDEAVFVRDGYVTECAHSNIFTVKNGVLITHPTNNFILPGITRKRLLYFAEKLGIPYRETPFTKGELISADAVLVSSTTRLANAVSEIDEIPLKKEENHEVNLLISALHEDYLAAF